MVHTVQLRFWRWFWRRLFARFLAPAFEEHKLSMGWLQHELIDGLDGVGNPLTSYGKAMYDRGFIDGQDYELSISGRLSRKPLGYSRNRSEGAETR